MKVNRSLPKSDKPDQEQTIEWSKLNLELADFCNSMSNRPENIVGNFSASNLTDICLFEDIRSCSQTSKTALLKSARYERLSSKN